jgi:hypothetical protein
MVRKRVTCSAVDFGGLGISWKAACLDVVSLSASTAQVLSALYVASSSYSRQHGFLY